MKNLTQQLKYFLLLFCGLFVLTGYMQADTFQKGRKIYFKPNSNWVQAGAWFKANFYQYGGENYTLDFSKVSGADGLYECTVPDNNYDHVNIYRYGKNGNYDTEWNHIWNIPAQSSKNLIVMSDGTWDGDNEGYTWDAKYFLSIQGDARFYGTDSNIGWGNWNKSFQRSSDSGEFFIVADGGFKLSTVENKPGNWDDFNLAPVRLSTGDNSIYANVTFKDWTDSNVGSNAKVYIKFTDLEHATAIVMSKDFPWVMFNKETGTSWETRSLDSPYSWTESDLKGKKANFQVIDGTKSRLLNGNVNNYLISGVNSKKYSLYENGTDFEFPEVNGTFTLTLSPSDGIPTELTVIPPEHTYHIYYSTNNGWVSKPITQGKEMSLDDVGGKQFIVRYKAPGQENFVNYGASNSGNVSEYAQSYTLNQNDVNFTLPGVEGSYKFLLTVDNNGKPVNIKITPPANEKKLYIGGAYHGSSNWFNPSEIRKSDNAFSTYTIAAEAGNKFRFYSVSNPSSDDKTTWIGPSSDTKINGTRTGLTSSADKEYVYEFESAGTYEIKVTNYSGSTVTFNVTKKAVVSSNVPKTLFIRHNMDSSKGWPDANLPQMMKVGNVFTYTLENYTPGTTVYFHFRENSSNFNGARVFPETDHTAAALNNANDAKFNTDGGDPYRCWTFTSDLSYPVVFKVDFNDLDGDDNGVKVYVTQDEPVVTGPAFWLHARFNDNWNSQKRVRFMPTADPKVLTTTVTYKEYLSGNQGFKITNKEFADNGDFYSAGAALENNVETPIDTKLTKNTTLVEAALNQLVTLTLKLDENEKPVNITASWSGEPITVGEQMRVYPVGVSNANGLKRYHEWPVMYLQGRVLNNSRITPEYQMTKVADGKYELEFTARDSRTQNDTWGWEDGNFYVAGYENANSDLKTFVTADALKLFEGKEPMSVGVRYKVVCEQGADGNWTLTFTEKDNDSKLPFISLIGAEWKQRECNDTPYHASDNRTTDSGWQEAWVQYDNRGQVLKDRDGKVMYNTMWPPKNPILFKTAFTVNGSVKDFTLTSKDLTFKRYETKSGAEWKKDARFADYASEKLEANKEYLNSLALRDEINYTLYRVEDVWINGNVKLWTGWGGVAGWSNGKLVANWSMNKNWGRWDMSKAAQEIHAGSTVPLAYEEGDMKFEQPTFFKFVDFFYDEENDVFVRNDNGKLMGSVGASVLFTERAVAGAQIAALSTNDYTEANFQTGLNDIANMSDAVLKKVVIRSYETVGDEGTEEMKSTVFTWNASGDDKTAKDFDTLFADRKVNSDFETNNDPIHEDNQSVSKWAKDETPYTAGDYFYRMTVVLVDKNGKEHTIVVDSNPFSIVKTESLSLSVYQLVKVEDKESNGVWTGHYYTYRTSLTDDTNTPLLPVYELWIENDSKFDGQFNVEYDQNGDLVNGYIDDSAYKFTYKSLDELPSYESQDLQFTDKVLVVGSVPSANDVVGYKYSAGNASGDPTPEAPGDPDELDNNQDSANQGESGNGVIAKSANGPLKAAATEEWDKSSQRPEYGDRFMYVTNVGSFEDREFQLEMRYTQEVLEDGKLVTKSFDTPKVVETYAAVVPTPVLKKAKVQVTYGDPNTNDDELEDFCFRGLKLENARYHSVRDYIEVDFPNVSRYLGDRMQIRDFFTLQLETRPTEGAHNPENQWKNVFTFASDENDANTWETNTGGVVVGDVMHPTVFNTMRYMTLQKRDGYNYYNRWEDGQITPISVTANAPINFDHQLVPVDAEALGISLMEGQSSGRLLFYQKEGQTDYMAAVTLRIQHSTNYTPSNPSDTHEGAMHDQHNYVFHTGKDDLFEHLHHHGPNDYYYVAIIDQTKRTESTQGDENAIIDANCNLGGVQQDGTDSRLHFVVPATQLLNGGSGLEVTISKNLGTPGSGESLEAFFNRNIENAFTKDLKVLVSYLYPFATTTPASPALNGMSRVVQDYSESVLKSNADEKAFPTLEVNDVVTAVPGLTDLSGSVTTGAGYIDVEGYNVEVYSAAGIKVGEGAGRHDVDSGVYVVRYNGRTVKVVVQ